MRDRNAERGAWQAAEVVAFLRSVREHRLYGALVLSALGLRRGEVCGLRLEHVDLTGDQAEARKLPKGTPSVAVVNNRVQYTDAATGRTMFREHRPKGKGRAQSPYLPLPGVAVDALRALHDRQTTEEMEAAEKGVAYESCPECGGTHLVVDELGRPYRPEWYSNEFTKLVKAAGLPELVLHGTRHAANSILANLGVPAVARMAWAGHTTERVNQGYTHADVEQLAAASKVLGEALAGSS